MTGIPKHHSLVVASSTGRFQSDQETCRSSAVPRTWPNGRYPAWSRCRNIRRASAIQINNPCRRHQHALAFIGAVNPRLGPQCNGHCANAGLQIAGLPFDRRGFWRWQSRKNTIHYREGTHQLPIRRRGADRSVLEGDDEQVCISRVVNPRVKTCSIQTYHWPCKI